MKRAAQGWTMGLLAGLIAAFVMTTPALAGPPDRSLAEQAAFLRPHTEIHLPAGAADRPVATAILFHGCGGRRAMQDEYAAALVAAGHGAIIIDSLTPRGIGRFAAMTQVCTALRLSGQARAADIAAGVEIARQTDGVDAGHLVLAGWSHGGWAILDLLTFAADGSRPPGLSEPADLTGVRAALLLYPYCSFPARSRSQPVTAGIAIDAVLAGRDLVASTADCRRILDRASEAGADVHHETWPGLTHAFDEAGNPDPRMQYNAEAAQAAHARLISILDEISTE